MDKVIIDLSAWWREMWSCTWYQPDGWIGNLCKGLKDDDDEDGHKNVYAPQLMVIFTTRIFKI